MVAGRQLQNVTEIDSNILDKRHKINYKQYPEAFWRTYKPRPTGQTLKKELCFTCDLQPECEGKWQLFKNRHRHWRRHGYKPKARKVCSSCGTKSRNMEGHLKVCKFKGDGEPDKSPSAEYSESLGDFVDNSASDESLMDVASVEESMGDAHGEPEPVSSIPAQVNGMLPKDHVSFDHFAALLGQGAEMPPDVRVSMTAEQAWTLFNKSTTMAGPYADGTAQETPAPLVEDTEVQQVEVPEELNFRSTEVQQVEAPEELDFIPTDIEGLILGQASKIPEWCNYSSNEPVVAGSVSPLKTLLDPTHTVNDDGGYLVQCAHSAQDDDYTAVFDQFVQLQ